MIRIKNYSKHDLSPRNEEIKIFLDNIDEKRNIKKPINFKNNNKILEAIG
jgi:hypothetical protein